MRKLFSLITAIFISFISIFATDSIEYEWWFDEDISSVRTDSFSSNQKDFFIDISELPVGAHYFNCRLKSGEGEYGSIFRKMFFLRTAFQQEASYEYWLDNDFENRTTGNLPQGSAQFEVDFGSMNPGLHYFNCRFFTEESGWGAVYRQMIFIAGKDTIATAYEYWLDNNYEAKVSGNVSQGEHSYLINLDGLSKGLHQFNYRLCDNKGVWGATFSKYFYYTVQHNSVIGYRYFINGRDLGYVSVPKQDSDSYLFDLQLPDDMKVSISEMQLVFDGDRISVSWADTLDGIIQLQSEEGWGSPQQMDIVRSVDFSTNAATMEVNSRLDLQAPKNGEFAAVRFNASSTQPLYFRADIPIALDIYNHNGTKVDSIDPNDLLEMKSLTLSNDTYYGILRDPLDGGSQQFTFHIMDLPNQSPKPVILFGEGVVTLVCDREDSEIYYTIDGSEPAENGTKYIEPFELTHNVVVKAISVVPDSDILPSDVEEFEIVYFMVDTPQWSYNHERKLLTLECATPEALISYALNAPENWIQYVEPVLIKNSCTIYAKAEALNYLESEIAEIVIGDFKCAEVTIDYNGRFLTLSTAEPDAEIRFSLDGSNPVDGEVYSEPFDAGGLLTVKAVAMKTDFMNSDVTEYTVVGYADEVHAETSMGGVLDSCFGWTEEGYLDSVESIAVEGRLNSDDYSLLHSMKSLRHLDIERVEEAVIPRTVFAESSLVTLSLPASIESIGDSILRDNPQLCAVIWNAKELTPDSIALKGITNRNLLLYLPNHDRADGNLGVIRNIIEMGRAESIMLSEGYPFYAPREFDADQMRYVRNFSKHTEIGVCSGWETLALPFEVETISDAIGEVTPFVSADETDRPFWLYKPGGTGWERTDEIHAYEPYLISMPNNPDYIEGFNIRGDVTFEATNVRMETTPEPTGYLYRDDVELWPNFTSLPADESMWVVNDDWYETELPGSNFVRCLRDVRPFECFVTSEIASQLMSIFEQSDVEGILAEMGTKIWCENHDLCILCGMSRKVRIYDTVGRLVRIAEVEAGKVCRVYDLPPGIYLIDRVKHMVK